MVQRLKVLVTVSDDLRSIARTHVVGRADSEIVLCPLLQCHTHGHTEQINEPLKLSF